MDTFYLNMLTNLKNRDHRKVLTTSVHVCLVLFIKKKLLVSSLLYNWEWQKYIMKYFEITFFYFFNNFQNSETWSFFLEHLLYILPSYRYYTNANKVKTWSSLLSRSILHQIFPFPKQNSWSLLWVPIYSQNVELVDFAQKCCMCMCA